MKRSLLFILLVAAVQIFAEEKCVELCSSCMGETKPAACSKVETLCKCAEMLDELMQEMSKQESVPESQPVSDSTEVPLAPQDSVAQADSVAKIDSLAQADSVAKIDSVAQVDSVAKDSSVPPVVDSVETANSTVDSTVITAEKPKTDTPPKDDIFYIGIMASFEMFQETMVAGYRVNESDPGIGGYFGFLLRWYFLDGVASIQTGLNGVFHYAYNDLKTIFDEYYFDSPYDIYDQDIFIEYYLLGAEIPLELRVGIPSKILRPFISTNANFRKPIFATVNYGFEVRVLDDSYSFGVHDREDGANWDHDFFVESDWEFVGYLGLGVEITRHFSLQYQWLLWSARTYDEVAYTSLDSWKVSMDIAW